MQAVILAAGRGTRMGSLTDLTPKPMLKIGNKNLLEYKIEHLPEEIDEIVFIIGYQGDTIRAHFGNEFKGRKITYIVQEKLEGTGKALWLAKDILNSKFLVMMGDDIYHYDDIKACLAYDWAVLVYRSQKEKNKGGKVVLDEQGHLRAIVEGEHPEKGILICTGLYVLQKDIFKYELVKLDGKEEWGLPQTLVNASKDFPVKAVESTFWLQITSPEDLVQADKVLVDQKDFIESILIKS